MKTKIGIKKSSPSAIKAQKTRLRNLKRSLQKYENMGFTTHYRDCSSHGQGKYWSYVVVACKEGRFWLRGIEYYGKKYWYEFSRTYGNTDGMWDYKTRRVRNKQAAVWHWEEVNCKKCLKTRAVIKCRHCRIHCSPVPVKAK